MPQLWSVRTNSLSSIINSLKIQCYSGEVSNCKHLMHWSAKYRKERSVKVVKLALKNCQCYFQRKLPVTNHSELVCTWHAYIKVRDAQRKFGEHMKSIRVAWGSKATIVSWVLSKLSYFPSMPWYTTTCTAAVVHAEINLENMPHCPAVFIALTCSC